MGWLGGAIGTVFGGPVGAAAGSWIGDKLSGDDGGGGGGVGETIGLGSADSIGARDPNAYSFGGRGSDYATDRLDYYDSRADMARRDAWRYDKPDWDEFYRRQGQAGAAQGNLAALGGRLRNVEAGRGPSVAREQLYAGMQQNREAMASQAASTRGGAGNQLFASRQAMQTSAANAQATNQQAAVLRAQEIAAARQQQADIYGSIRKGSMDLSGLEMQRQAFDQQNDMARRNQAFNREQFYEDKRYGVDQAQQQGAMALQGSNLATDQANAGLYNDAQKRRAEFTGSMVQTAAGAAAKAGGGGGRLCLSNRTQTAPSATTAATSLRRRHQWSTPTRNRAAAWAAACSAPRRRSVRRRPTLALRTQAERRAAATATRQTTGRQPRRS